MSNDFLKNPKGIYHVIIFTMSNDFLKNPKGIFHLIISIAKSKDGMLGKDRTMLDGNRRVTFGYVDNNNQIVEVKIPLDGVEVNAGSATE